METLSAVTMANSNANVDVFAGTEEGRMANRRPGHHDLKCARLIDSIARKSSIQSIPSGIYGVSAIARCIRHLKQELGCVGWAILKSTSS